MYLLTSFKRFLPVTKKARFLWEAEKRHIPVFKLKDVNSSESLKLIKSFQPDFLISYFNQLLKKEILALPRRGSLNVHPGYLPLYRGVASSFWAMLNNGDFGGSTVHFMIEKLDCGDIIEQGKVPVRKDVSLHRHNYLCCQLGGKLLLTALGKAHQNKLKGSKQGKGNYYSWPKEQEVKKFQSEGYRLMEPSDLELY